MWRLFFQIIIQHINYFIHIGIRLPIRPKRLRSCASFLQSAFARHLRDPFLLLQKLFRLVILRNETFQIFYRGLRSAIIAVGVLIVQ